MTNTRKLRCNRISVYEQNQPAPAGGANITQVVTERGFSSNGEDGKPLNGPEVQSVSYSDSTIADEQDTSVKLNDIVVVTVAGSPITSSSVKSSN